MDYSARLARLREALDQKRLDALLVMHLPNVRYLCGFTGSNGALIAGTRRLLFFTDGRYTAQARKEVHGARVVISKGALLAEAAKHLEQLKVRTLGFEAEHLSAAALARFKPLLPRGVKLRSTSNMVEQLRITKDDVEIERVRRAVLLGASLFDAAVKAIRPGVKETDVAGEMEHEGRRKGAEGMSFETIVA